MNDLLLASLSAKFTGWDWAVVAGYLILTTWLGAKLAGKQQSMRDFFLGGRRLPWYAVSGSIIATEISAVTFVGAPFIAFAAGGDFTYLQLGLIGTLLARIIVGYVLVPAYYKREIYSPYDYIGNQLGGNTRGVASALFALGGVLAQSARVYLTALVLTVVLSGQLDWLSAQFGANPLAWAIIIITIVAVIWTLIGGITTVVWTDVMLFLMFVAGAAVALFTVASRLDGGFGEIFAVGWAQRAADPAWWDWGKFTFFNFETGWPEIFTHEFTIWAAVIAATWGSLGPYGTDQLIVQRLFCCQSEKHARRAIIVSTSSQIVTTAVLLIGVGLFAYYSQQPAEPNPAVRSEVLSQVDPSAAPERHPEFPRLTGEALELFEKEPNRIFPIFIVDVIPVGLKGMLIAGIFAAAISSLTSILAALSQTVMSAFYLPLRQRVSARRHPDADPAALADAEDRHSVFMGRVFVLIWGVVLAVMAYYVQEMAEIFPEILNLALAMAGFAGGALLAGFFLGFWRTKADGWGYQFAAPLSVLYVFAVVFHELWSHWVCAILGAVLVVWWAFAHRNSARFGRPPVIPVPLQFFVLLLGIAGMLLVNFYGHFGTDLNERGETTYKILAWPWYVPIGSTVAFVWGYLLARQRQPDAISTESEQLATQ